MAARAKRTAGEKHPWRENIEALTMAIAVALLFKYFFLEISRIPSGSMQPTLMGDPGTQTFDRVLVDKLSMHYRDPKRWEIVVFKHPVERSRIMVKRLVGMPDEDFMIAKGDLWTRADESQPWKILRRPPEVQDEMWLELVGSELEGVSPWSAVSGGHDWSIVGDSVAAKGDGRIRYREQAGPIRDDYLDGYPAALLHEMPRRRGPRYVGDLRVTGSVRPEEGLETLVLQLTEGSRSYEFHVPGPAATEDRPTITITDPSASPSERTVTAEAPLRLAAGERVSFGAQNLDDRLALEIDGETVVATDIPAADDQRAFVTLGLDGSGGSLADLKVYRDVYYLADPSSQLLSWHQHIPPGCYLMLGDNTQDSADSRDWRAKRMYLRSDVAQENPATSKGNYRPGENPIEARGADGEPLYRFLDEWGDVHWLPKAEYVPGLEFRAPFVPRELIQGRAVAVFWPLRPLTGLWRLTWLH